MAMDKTIQHSSLMPALYLVLMLTSLCHGDVEHHCPPAKLGHPYVFPCTGETSSHHRSINWIRDQKGGLFTVASCAQDSSTPKCGGPETSKDCIIFHESYLYTVSSCISNISSSSISSSSSSSNHDHHNSLNRNGYFFASSLKLQNVTMGDIGAIFFCKVVDRTTNTAQRKGKCELKEDGNRSKASLPSMMGYLDLVLFMIVIKFIS